MENYIVINGKKAELTKEQLKALGIEVPKTSVFDRREKGEGYYFIKHQGEVEYTCESNFSWDEDVYNIANYCADSVLMKQRALHETLNRLLWRFSMTHNGDKLNWNDYGTLKYCIYYNHRQACFSVDWHSSYQSCDIYFHTKEIAQQAIKEIIKPFIAEHPEFKW